MSKEFLGFNVWTKNMPQPFLEKYVQFADTKSLPVVAIVDDVLPALTFHRSKEETDHFNQAYVNRMSEIGFHDVHLVSELLPEADPRLSDIIEIANQVSLSVFMNLLPEKKRSKIDQLSLTEIVDTCWQLQVLESGIVKLGITKYLTGKRSTAFFRMAKTIIAGFNFDIIDE